MLHRPIRELLNFKELLPTSRGGVVRNRRTTDRFKCRLPAVLMVAGREFPVECQEISTIGARISSMRPLPVALQRDVLLKIRIGEQNFQDRFVVARISQNREGPISMQLGLRTSEPAGAADS